MKEFVRMENLRRFRGRLAIEKDPAVRRLLESLILEFDGGTVGSATLANKEAAPPPIRRAEWSHLSFALRHQPAM